MAVYRVRGPNGNEATITVPSDAMDQRTFDARVERGEFTVLSDEPDASEAPPKKGRGSGRDAWATYAESKGVEVTEEMSRDDIIEAVEG